MIYCHVHNAYTHTLTHIYIKCNIYNIHVSLYILYAYIHRIDTVPYYHFIGVISPHDKTDHMYKYINGTFFFLSATLSINAYIYRLFRIKF